jgi:hypothetical protein
MKRRCSNNKCIDYTKTVSKRASTGDIRRRASSRVSKKRASTGDIRRRASSISKKVKFLIPPTKSVNEDVYNTPGTISLDDMFANPTPSKNTGTISLDDMFAIQPTSKNTGTISLDDMFAIQPPSKNTGTISLDDMFAVPSTGNFGLGDFDDYRPRADIVYKRNDYGDDNWEPIIVDVEDDTFRFLNKKRNTSVNANTPRSLYAKKYFNDSNIYLVDQVSSEFPNPPGSEILFQVNYTDVNQFLYYTNLHDMPRLDCLYQSLFALGIRDTRTSKKEAADVNKHGKIGVTNNEVEKFIKNAFGLKEGQVATIFDTIPFTDFNSYIREFFQPNLKNGCATVFLIHVLEKKMSYFHYIICFRNGENEEDIFFFDPQKKRSNSTENYIVSDISDLYKKIDEFGYFEITGLLHPMPLIDNTCPIIYMGGNKL